MRLPSLENLRASARTSASRFPFVILIAILATVAGIGVVETQNDDTWTNFLLAAQLGIALMFAIAVAGEVGNWTRSMRVAVSGAGLVLLAAYAMTLPGDITVVSGTRHAQFTIGMHLLVAFAPFTRTGSLNGFWQYNRALFLRFCLSVLYSAVLYAGLAIALLAVDRLLGVDVRDETYFELWIAIAMVFNTWFFCGGLPESIAGLEDVTDYTRGLRVFAQYILVPLVIIYLAILTAYLGKIVVTQQWPSGELGWLVSSVAVVGILANLLVYPIRERTDSQWVRTYARWYYVAMVPAVFMLLLAIGKRIGQYGVTENRYLLLVMAVWLAGISLYFIATRARNIKLIPVTLSIVAFATSFGPWGAFSVSERSQWNRLTGMLERNDILVAGAIQKAPSEVSFEDRREISAVLDYLVKTHGPGRIAPLLGERWEKLDSVTVWDREKPIQYGGPELVRRITEEMGFSYVAHWETTGRTGSDLSLQIDPNVTVLPLDEADVMVQVNMSQQPAATTDPPATVGWNPRMAAFIVTVAGDTLVLDPQPWAEELVQSYGGGTPGYGTISLEQARIEAESDRVHAILYIRHINGVVSEDSVEIRNVGGWCFLDWKD